MNEDVKTQSEMQSDLKKIFIPVTVLGILVAIILILVFINFLGIIPMSICLLAAILIASSIRIANQWERP